jgi:hypothetical protein
MEEQQLHPEERVRFATSDGKELFYRYGTVTEIHGENAHVQFDGEAWIECHLIAKLQRDGIDFNESTST